MRIEKNIPIPRSHRRKYRFREMEVNDSMLIVCAKKDRLDLQKSVWSSCWRLKPMKFTTRQEAGGVRVWRVK